MTWLKKFGLDVLKVIQVVSGILGSGVIQSAYPSSSGVITTVQSDLTTIATIITDVETAFAAAQASGVAPLPTTAGPLKLAAATPLVAAAINKSALMQGQKIANPNLYAAAVKGLTSNFADLLNSLDASSIQTTKL
jgi:hypothetical protein